MPRAALNLDKFGGVVRAASLLDERQRRREEQAARWGRQELAGRLVELSAGRAGSALTVAMGLVWQAQMEAEPVAWVHAAGSSDASSFYPPDVARGGIDLGALAVVRVADGHKAARAADKLARSGGFGLVVLDLGGAASPPTPLMRRLLEWAEEHDMALLCLTDRPEDAPAICPLVSLRAVAGRRRVGEDRFECRVDVVRDKQRSPGWSHEEVCCGPPGLR